ncbi:MAG: integrase arm-type DNA-binding domain-containing protein [Paracoccus sp. (in: a-proteobacteria)]|uniref:tyrosine-type recombinase/integrase n=1 Tax=Paracoccus sp. TaxID=267 RepID=UPI0026DEDFD8|nr:site-specific integrase [Paracoccus sp. (in: a-proteobacteria)]MDO5621193.1 integrase arm-type DNA-binding domain-containing protein [Paracoccus sp. (in: a-proteobacteria)]
MAKNVLTAVAIKKAGDGKLFDGGGLTLVKAGDNGKWVYRYSHLGRRREMGLGAWPTVSLAAARAARDGWAAELATGRDPIEIRSAARAKEAEDRSRIDPTFAEAAQAVLEAKREGLRGGGDRGRWFSPLQQHVLPHIGRKRMSEITQHDLADALRPIWKTKHPTALKAWRRTRVVLTEGKLLGYGCDPVIADAAARMLGEVRHIDQHIEATPWQRLPELYKALPDTVAGDCLRWIILTVVRSDGCRGARLAEINGGIWTVPADRIKGRVSVVRDFSVPLPEQAQTIANRIQPFAVDGAMFPGSTGRPISSTALTKALNGIGEAGRPHGFRTSFSTWAQDTQACAWDVRETILGHTIGSKVERSYARSDLLDQRRPVMQAWADYVTGQ